MNQASRGERVEMMIIRKFLPGGIKQNQHHCYYRREEER
jgi:hypothetical protein